MTAHMVRPITTIAAIYWKRQITKRIGRIISTVSNIVIFFFSGLIESAGSEIYRLVLYSADEPVTRAPV
jgi:hypothetical protein